MTNAASDTAKCSYCHATVPNEASKCAACGEWLDSRWRLSGAGKICLALVSVVACLMAVVAFVWIPTFKSMFAEFGHEVPTTTWILTSQSWMIGWLMGVISLVVAAFGITQRRRTRTTILALALFVGLGACVLTWWGSLLPIHDLTREIEAE